MQGSEGEPGSHTLYTYVVYTCISLFIVFRYHPDNIPRTFNDYREQKHGNVFKEEEYCCYMFGIGVMTYLSLFMSVQSFCTISLFRISGLCLPRTCVCLVILCACTVQRVLVSSLRGNYHRIHEIFSFKLKKRYINRSGEQEEKLATDPVDNRVDRDFFRSI